MSINPNWPDQPKKTGMSTAAKVILWVCGIFVVLGVLCCGVFLYFGRQLQNSFSEDPKVTAELTQNIVDWQIPQEFVPKGSVKLFSVMTMVFYEHQPPKGVLMIGEFGKMFANQDKNQLEAQMRNSMREQGKDDGKKLQIEEEKTHKFTIRGKETEFTFAKAKEPESKLEMWQVSGAFEGKGGPAFLLLQVERDQYTEEELKELIGGIE